MSRLLKQHGGSCLVLVADEPVETAKALGCAAVVYTEEEDWSVGLAPDACRAIAARLLELAAKHDRRFGEAVRQ